MSGWVNGSYIMSKMLFKAINQLLMLSGSWRNGRGPREMLAAVGCACKHQLMKAVREVPAGSGFLWHRELSGLSLGGAASIHNPFSPGML